MMAVADVLKTIADDKSLVLFNTIALSNSDSDILISFILPENNTTQGYLPY
jgi:hypothetical protein